MELDTSFAAAALKQEDDRIEVFFFLSARKRRWRGFCRLLLFMDEGINPDQHP